MIETIARIVSALLPLAFKLIDKLWPQRPKSRDGIKEPDHAFSKYVWPTRFKKILFGYGRQDWDGVPYTHNGVDIKSLLFPVVAIEAGTIVAVKNPHPKYPVSHVRKDGKWVRIAPPGIDCRAFVQVVSDSGLVYHYAHVKPKPGLQIGQWVEAGEEIGTPGKYGMATGPHLHLELYQRTHEGETPVNPEDFMRQKFDL